MELDQIHVFGIISNPFLDLGTLFINDTQIALVHCRCTEQDLIYKTHFLLCTELPYSPLYKMLENGGLLCTYGDQIFRSQDDAQRDRGIVFGFMTDLRSGNIHKDQRISVLQVNTGTFFLIQCGPYIRYINFKIFRDFLAFLHRRIDQIDPCALLKFIQLMNDAIIGSVNSQHTIHTCLS